MTYDEVLTWFAQQLPEKDFNNSDIDPLFAKMADAGVTKDQAIRFIKEQVSRRYFAPDSARSQIMEIMASHRASAQGCK